jgi:hypothetical protein
MAFNTYGAPYLGSYARALEHYNSVTPIRGSDGSIKPIGVRRYHEWARMERRGDDILLVFERTPCVVWRPDNTFTLYAPQFYHSYQAEKLAGWLPWGFYFLWDKKRLFVRSRKTDETVHLPNKGKLDFAPVDPTALDLGYKCVTSTESREYKARRMVADKLMRNRFEPFLAWAQVVVGGVRECPYYELDVPHKQFLTALGYTPEKVAHYEKSVEPLDNSAWKFQVNRFINLLHRVPFSRQAGNPAWFSRPGCEHLYKLLTSQDYEQWLLALDVINRQGGEFVYSRGKSTHRMTYAMLEEYLKALVSFLYRDKVFEVTPVEAGAIPSARNAQYFVELEHPF